MLATAPPCRPKSIQREEKLKENKDQLRLQLEEEERQREDNERKLQPEEDPETDRSSRGRDKSALQTSNNQIHMS